MDNKGNTETINLDLGEVSTAQLALNLQGYLKKQKQASFAGWNKSQLPG